MESLKKLFYNPSYEEPVNFFAVVRNIHNILNTRSALSATQFLENQFLSAIYFGLPSFTHLSMESAQDRKMLCKFIEKSIQNFEHRLSFIEIEFFDYDKLKKEAKLSLKAVYSSNDITVNLILKIAFWEFIVNDWQI